MDPERKGLITSINPPPSIYGQLTKGSLLEPWIYKAALESFYLGKPFNCWDRNDSAYERVVKMGHIGVCIGAVKGISHGYFYCLDNAIRGSNCFKSFGAYKTAAFGFGTGLLMSTAFTASISALSYLKGKEDTAFDWYLGGITGGLVAAAAGQLRQSYYSKKYNLFIIGIAPLYPACLKYLQAVNVYDDWKGFRYASHFGGLDQHNAAEMEALYGICRSELPLHEVIPNDVKKEMMFLKPRKNPIYNDKFRVEVES